MSIRHVRLKIEGMSCQACAARIEKVLNKKEFVSAAAVNFAGEEAQISYDDSQTDAAALIRIVEKTGFGASEAVQKLPENPPKTRMPLWLVLLLAASIPFWIGMAGMLAGSHALMPPLWMQIALASAAQLGLAWPFYRGAWASLRGGLANMDVLVTLGTGSIYLYSLYAAQRGGDVYFEAGVMVLAFVSLGKFWEERTKRNSLNSLNLLLKLLPREAEAERGGQWQRVPLAQIRSGDRLRCLHGGRIVADGTVLAGEAWADESHLTGESRPVHKVSGSKVSAGALISGSLEYRADALGEATLLGDMMNALAEAQGSKAPISRLADRVTAVFVPAVVAAALLTFALTWQLSGSLEQAVVHAVAVLVVACPCALGLATPAAVMAGMGAAVKRGIWFKNAAVLERAGKVDTVIFDKTGTLTEGRFSVADVWLPENAAVGEARFWQLAAAVERHSLHPLAEAVISEAAARGFAADSDTAARVQTFAGEGIAAEIDGAGSVRVGKPEFCGFRLPENGRCSGSLWQSASIVAVSVNGAAAGAIVLADTLKADSRAAVQRLQQAGIELRILSGDHAAAVAHTAAELGISQAQGNCMPRQKAAAVQQLQAQGKVVGMVGDGINDAAALAAADVGFAVYGSTDVAEHSAAVTLLHASPQRLADALLLARATLRTIRQNLFFAFFYNILTIPLAASGKLSPVLAGLAMVLSSVSVLLNALRLKRWSNIDEDFR